MKNREINRKVIVKKTLIKNIDSNLDYILNKLGGLDKYVNKEDTVFIKPNLFIRGKPESGIITHPRLVVELARKCKELGAEVIIGERGGSIHYNFSSYPEINKYAEVVDLDQAEFKLFPPKKDNKVINFPLPVPEIFLEAEVKINLPGLRTHVLTLMSNALKNIMGLLPGSTTRLIHLAGLREAIIDLNNMIKFDFHLTDAIYTLEEFFPATRGEAVRTNFLMAAEDPVALDTVAADLMGFKEKIPLIEWGAAKGLGTSEKSKIKVINEDNLCFNLKRPVNDFDLDQYTDYFNIFIENACIQCKRALYYGIKAFFESGGKEILKNNKEINIIAGNSYFKEFSHARNLLYGNCAKRYADNGIYESGCPPLTGVVKRKLETLIDKS